MERILFEKTRARKAIVLLLAVVVIMGIVFPPMTAMATENEIQLTEDMLPDENNIIDDSEDPTEELEEDLPEEPAVLDADDAVQEEVYDAANAVNTSVDAFAASSDPAEESAAQSVSVELWNSTDTALSSAWLRNTATLTTTDGKTTITLFTQAAGQGSMTAYLKGLSVDGSFSDAVTSGTLVEGQNFPERFTVEIAPSMEGTQSIPVKVKYTPYPVPNGFPFPDGHEVTAHLHILWGAGGTTPVVDKSELAAQLTVAKAITSGNYTTESYDALQRAITTAQSVYDSDGASQGEIDAQVMVLANAIAVLAEKPAVLADGNYTISAQVLKATDNVKSMLHGYLAEPDAIPVIVVNGKITVALKFNMGNYSLQKLEQKIGDDFVLCKSLSTDTYTLPIDTLTEDVTIRVTIGGTPMGPQTARLVLDPDTLTIAKPETVTQSVSVELWNSADTALSSAWLKNTATLTTTDGKTTITLFTQAAGQGSMTAYLRGLSVDGSFTDAAASGTLVEGENFPERFTVEIAPSMEGTQSIPVKVKYTPYPVPNGFPFPNGHEVTAHLHIIWGAEKETPIVDKSELAAQLAFAKSIKQGNYTDISYQILQSSIKVAQGVYDSKYATLTEVNEQISALTNAVNGLILRPTEAVNKYGMTDGKYEVRVDLWHATQNQASMGNGSLNHTGLIEVVGDTLYMSVSVHPMQVGTVTASLASLQIKQATGNYVYAEVTARNIEGNKPSAYRFVLPSKDTFIPVKIDPQVSVMGNETMDARLYISWDTLTKVSADTIVSGNVLLTAASSAAEVSQKQTLNNISTGIKVEADANVLPDGTTLDAREITSGVDYNKAAKALGGIVKSFVLYDITLTGPNGDTVQPNGKVKVSIPLPADMDATDILIYRINADGSKTLMEGSVEGGFVVFMTTHFSLYAVGEKVDEDIITKTAVDVDTFTDDAVAPLTAGDGSGVSLLWLLIPIAGAAILATVIIIRRKLRMQ